MAHSQSELYDRYIGKLIPSITPYDITDINRNVRDMTLQYLNRTSQIFEWTNLPETITQRMLELYLQTNGNVCVTEINGSLYALIGGLGGEPNAYYMPTLYTVANPALHYSANLTISDDCIVIPNDTMYAGLLPIIRKYCTMIAESEISLRVNLINARVPALVSADNTSIATSANEALRDIEKGKLKVITGNEFSEGLKSIPYSNNASHSLTDIVEIIQYLRATLINELGLQSNFNMKREQLTDDEVGLNDTALLPLIDDMLRQRQIACKSINAKYGTNIAVSLNSSWELTQKRIEDESGVTDEASN